MASFMIQCLTRNLLQKSLLSHHLVKASKSLSSPLLGTLCSRLNSGVSGNNHDDDGTNSDNKDSIAHEADLVLKQDATDDDLTPSKALKYKLFEHSEEELILDYTEEFNADHEPTDYPSDDIPFLHRKAPSKFDSVNLERGKIEVIDLEELVDTLRKEQMKDIAVIEISPDLNYCNYMIIASAKSPRHLRAVTEFIVKLWKLKKHVKDKFLKVEGGDCPDWKVLDMNSMIVHLFLPEAREKYDLESLWAIGSEFDDIVQRPIRDVAIDLLERHLIYLQTYATEPEKLQKEERRANQDTIAPKIPTTRYPLPAKQAE